MLHFLCNNGFRVGMLEINNLGDRIGDWYRGYSGDTRSLDHGPYRGFHHLGPLFGRPCNKDYRVIPHMGGCQNYGPLLGTLNNRCRIIIGIQKGTLIFTSNHILRCPTDRQDAARGVIQPLACHNQ